MERETTKKSTEQIEAKGGEILQSPIMEEVVTNMVDKSSQAQQQCQHIMKMYDALQHVVSEVGGKQ
jgi:gamma-glutamyl:cysteine ligase YbdK (ATP-grasp superfamily)